MARPKDEQAAIETLVEFGFVVGDGLIHVPEDADMSNEKIGDAFTLLVQKFHYAWIGPNKRGGHGSQ